MRKVFKNGNSLAVTVPKSYAHDLNIRDGSKIEWKKTQQGLVLLTQKKVKAATEIDPKVVELIDKIDQKYTQVWKELAKL